MVPQRYKIQRRIAVGGMAEIYLATVEGDASRPVVLKRILPSLSVQPSFVKAFLHEAELLSHLDHPNVARVVGFAGGTEPYIAMDYVRGADLARTLKRFRLIKRWPDLGFVGQVMADLLAGLEHAHGATALGGRPLGIIHRDVTPHNVIVGFDGLTRLVDFGVARTELQTEHTRSGVVKGKLAYLAPEQLDGGVLDGRVDLFAAGIVLYELLCLRHPFAGASDGATIRAILRAKPIPPREVRRDIPFALQAVVMRALAGNPAERFRDAREMLWALTAAVGTIAGHRTVASRITRLFPDGPPAESGDQPGSEPLTPPGHGVPPDPAELLQITPSPAAGQPLPAPLRTLPREPWRLPTRQLLAVGATLLALGTAAAVLGLLPTPGASADEAKAAPVALASPAPAGALAARADATSAVLATAQEALEREPAPTGGGAPAAQLPPPTLQPPPPARSAAPAGSTVSVSKPSTTKRPARPARLARPPAAPRLPGTLRIEAPTGISVLVDGTPLGVTPLPPLSLAAGRHEVLLRHESGGERLRRVRILSGRELVLR